MSDVYYKTLILILTIALGYFLHRVGIFDKNDARTISKIMMNVTLPSVVIKNLNGVELNSGILIAALTGLAVNLLFFSMTFIFSRRGDAEDRVVNLFSFCSFNIGSYAIPVLSTFVGPYAMAGVLAFNYPGTAIGTYGLPPAIGSAIMSGKSVSPLRSLRDNLLKNVPTVTCFGMLLLCLLHIRLPESVAGVFASISAANATLAMLSIGILLDLNLPKREVLMDLRVVVIRFCAAVICALAIFFFLPAPDELRRALTLVVFAPISSTMPAIALHCGYGGSRVAVINSLYLIVSICAMSCAIFVLY